MSYPENDPQEPKVLPGYFGPAAAPPQAERVQPAAAAPHHEPARQPFGQPGALSLPLPSASLGQAVGRLYGKYAVFGGRASRSEFWWVQLFMAGVIVLAAMLDSLIGTDVVAGLFGMFALASIVPCVALTVRRLHDANFSPYPDTFRRRVSTHSLPAAARVQRPAVSAASRAMAVVIACSSSGMANPTRVLWASYSFPVMT